VHIGNAGTGFSDATRRDLRARLEELEQPDRRSTFRLRARGGPRWSEVARWVRPTLVGDVAYREYRGGALRHPSWKSLRIDKTSADVKVPNRTG
jgi:bifunctional non-homologous end joining protein LigD